MTRKILTMLFYLTLVFNVCFSAIVIVPIRLVSLQDNGASLGTVTAIDTTYGLLLIPHLYGLSPGAHGFHVHINPSCKENGLTAGGHLDPNNTSKHLGPYNSNGHLGDLPILYVNQYGSATLPLLAPRLTVDIIKGHALMIHAGGDNYSDNPSMGGGGARIACGVIK
ncbi:MAG: superoxide dismutase [Gammaproteobacteria bacterium RIFCSPHIGHO2_12_FULL_35_23]|nr:MAG: superoxide dismutase [Gammaproteobacteria bacterium RIFCSPHIGHO2_12_FULL_35_23]